MEVLIERSSHFVEDPTRKGHLWLIEIMTLEPVIKNFTETLGIKSSLCGSGQVYQIKTVVAVLATEARHDVVPVLQPIQSKHKERSWSEHVIGIKPQNQFTAGQA